MKRKTERFLPYEEAREIIISKKLSCHKDYKKYINGNEYDNRIPKSPHEYYKNNGWISWGNFLGTNNLSTSDRIFVSYKDASNFSITIGIKTQLEWTEFCKSGNRPHNIPSNPFRVYKNNGWVSWSHFLGKDPGKPKVDFLFYKGSEDFIRPFKLKSQLEWAKFCNAGNRPHNVPRNPDVVYKDKGWVSWYHFLGYKGMYSQTIKLHLLNTLEHSDLLSMDPFEIYTIIEQGKLPNDFRVLANTDAGSEERIKTLKELKELFKKEEDVEELHQDKEFIQIDAIDEEITNLNSKKENKLDVINTVSDLHSLDNDIYSTMGEEAFKSLIQYKLHKLWNDVLNENIDIKLFQNEIGGKYFTMIKKLFLKEYNEVKSYEPKPWYSFNHEPNLMQKLDVVRLMKNKYNGNWSGTGAGKTLSFIIASREIESKLTIVVVVNSTLKQTCKVIKEVYPDSEIYTQYTEGFTFDRSKHNFLVLNYEKFQQKNSEKLFQDLTDNNLINYIVIDEVQNVKQTNEKEESIRRGVLSRMLVRIREKNPNVYVSVLSATPVVNNLFEAKSLLKLLTGLEYNDLDTRKTLSNALKIFQQLLLKGIRYLPKYDIEINELTGSNMSILNIDGSHLLESILELSKSNYVSLEKLLLEEKLKATKPLLRKGVILYSYYTTGFIDKIKNYVEELGYSVGTYTGEEDTIEREENLSKFISGEIDILIGSDPIGTGVDGLQGVCNEMIIITLPWTDSKYTQLKGRIYRQGSLFGSVEIIIPQVRIELEGGDFWSWDVQRLNVIKNKKTLADAAVDGVIPSRILPSKETMFRKSQESLQKWKDRVNNINLISLYR